MYNRYIHNTLQQIRFYKFIKNERSKTKKLRNKWAKEYNWTARDSMLCGPVKFIWGITSQDKDQLDDASFITLNDFEIHFNQDTSKYYMVFDNIPETYHDQEKYMTNIYVKLVDYIEYTRNIKIDDTVCYENFLASPTEADSLKQLYYNFTILYKGMQTENLSDLYKQVLDIIPKYFEHFDYTPLYDEHISVDGYIRTSDPDFKILKVFLKQYNKNKQR